MDVFLKDPLMDWKKELRKLEAAANTAKVQKPNNIGQYAAGKLKLARMKLERYNPTVITEMELAKNTQPNVIAHFDGIKKVLVGVPGVNVRAAPENKKQCKDAWTQVECLIDQATDPTILSRCWQGLAPWY